MAILVAVSTAYPVKEQELSKERQQKASSYRNAQDCARCLCAGVALDEALRSVGLREKDVTVGYGEHGKPFPKDHPHLHFNLSHSGNWAVCALSDSPIGVDVEKLREVDVCSLAKRWLPAEQAATLNEQSIEAFFSLWTRRESLLKAQGVGLSEISAAKEDGYFFREYPLDGYSLTVCTSGAFPESLIVIK